MKKPFFHFCMTGLIIGIIVRVGPVYAQSAHLFPLRQLVGDRYETVVEWGFQNQLFLVRKNGLYGFIDGQGRVLIAPQYEQTEGFGLNVIGVKKNDKWGVINRKGEIVLRDPQNKKFGCYNPVTAVFLPVVYDYIQSIDSLGFMSIRQSNGCAIFNPAGRAVSDFEYLRDGNRDCFIVRKSGRFALYSKNRTAVKPLTPFSFDNIYREHNCFVTDINLRKGLLAPDGHELLPAKFNDVSWVGKDCWIAWGRDFSGIQRTDGTIIAPFEYSWISADFPYGFILKKADKFGFSDYEGKLLLPFEYDQIVPIKEDPGTYCTVKNGKTGIFKL